MQLTIDTDKILKGGYNWVRRNVPLAPTLLTMAAAYGARYLWLATYLDYRAVPGQFDRNTMVVVGTVAAAMAATFSWTEYNDRRRKAREP